jgi:hypothetical protein
MVELAEQHNRRIPDENAHGFRDRNFLGKRNGPPTVA